MGIVELYNILMANLEKELYIHLVSMLEQ